MSIDTLADYSNEHCVLTILFQIRNADYWCCIQSVGTTIQSVVHISTLSRHIRDAELDIPGWLALSALQKLLQSPVDRPIPFNKLLIRAL